MKRSIYWVTFALAAAACVDTTLDTPKNHPANPAAYPAAPAQPPLALSNGFDPFAAYASEAEPGAAAREHNHAHAAEPAAAPAASSDPTSLSEATPPEARTPKQAPADDVLVYTCPMHPEITRNAPGNCPICGMKLVPKKSPKPSNP